MKNKRGITLIALVITIIVLLVLAGVSLSLVLGDNGIIKKSIKSEEKTNIEYEKELLGSSVVDVKAELVLEQKQWEDLELSTFQNVVNKSIGNDKVLVYGDKNNFVAEFIESDRYYLIDENGKITRIGNAAKVSNNPEKYYGKTVKNYVVEDNELISAWKIFYADNENIYLIAANGITLSQIPSVTFDGIEYGDGITSIVTSGYYKGMEDIQNPKIMKYLNYKKLYPESKTTASKCTAYLLDTETWNLYSNEFAEFCIGSPTLEMYVNSYNQTHSTMKIDCNQIDSYGYYVKDINDSESQYAYGLDNIIDQSNDLNMYFINAQNLFLSSPSADRYNGYFENMMVKIASRLGKARVISQMYNGATGSNRLRPIICLKDNVYISDDYTLSLIEIR